MVIVLLDVFHRTLLQSKRHDSLFTRNFSAIIRAVELFRYLRRWLLLRFRSEFLHHMSRRVLPTQYRGQPVPRVPRGHICFDDRLDCGFSVSDVPSWNLFDGRAGCVHTVPCGTVFVPNRGNSTFSVPTLPTGDVQRKHWKNID